MSIHGLARANIRHTVRRPLPQASVDNVERLRSRMHMHRGLGARRAIAVIDAQEILWRGERRHRSNLRNLGAARGRATHCSQGEEPGLSVNFSSQGGVRLVTYRIRVPTVFARGYLCCLKRGKILD